MNSYITISDAKAILSLDGVTTQIDRNSTQLQVLANTWCWLVYDLGDDICPILLRRRLVRKGLVSTVEHCDDLYLQFVGGQSIADLTGVDSDFLEILARVFEASGLVGVIQALRFARRFTYIGVDDDGSYDKFLECNQHCWSLAKERYDRGSIDSTRNETLGNWLPGPTLILAVKHEIECMVGPWPLNLGEGGFSSGVTAEGCHCIADRIFVLSRYCRSWDLRPDGLLHFCGSGTQSMNRRLPVPVMIQVPKTLTKRRLICPEPAVRAYFSYRVRAALEARLMASGTKKFLAWDDQSVNRGYALLGSVGGDYATIDMSAASDTQSRDITFRVFPEAMRAALFTSISDRVVVRGNEVGVNCFSTSGNQLTWLVEAIYFLAIARVASRWYGTDCWAYGDDLIVSASAYDSVCELLELFGHRVNRDKSYAGAHFRESCGGEYFDGECVTPVYWPRRALDFEERAETLASLCSMQHRLYRYPHVRYYLEDVVAKLDPKITYSPVGDECDDLWDGSKDFITSNGEHHRHIVTRWKRSEMASDPDYFQSFMDWQYFSFLADGPLYLTDEDRAWGISSSRASIDYYSISRTVWR